jgi:hypothetical protein
VLDYDGFVFLLVDLARSLALAQQDGKLYTQGVGECPRAGQTDVALSAFHRPDVGAVQAGAMGKFFLRHTCVSTSSPHRRAKQVQTRLQFGVAIRHVADDHVVMTMSRQTMSSICREPS